MGIIDPEIGAIANFLWVEAQEGIKTILEAISTAQTAINPDYAFTTHLNKYSPQIEDMDDTGAMVNIRVGDVKSEDVTNFSATHKVTYYIDCYVRGKNEDDPDPENPMVPADEVAVQRLHYLAAMVYSGMTNLKDFYKSLKQGQIVPGDVNIVFNPVKDVENSAEPYAPAQITFTCKFPYESEDLSDLPEYKATFTDLGSWAAQIFKE